MSNLTDVEFVVLTRSASTQTYTVEIREAIQNISVVVAGATSPAASAPTTPAIVSTQTKSNVPYMATLSYNFTFNASDYLLIELPAATKCCSQLFIDTDNLSAFSYVNTSTGLLIKTSTISAGVHNLSLVNINLTSGFTSGGLFKITEFTGQIATSQHLLNLQTTTFVEDTWRLLLSDSSAGFPYANYTFTLNTTYSPLAETDLVLTFLSSSYPFSTLPSLEQVLIDKAYQQQLPTIALIAPGKLRISNIAYGRVTGMVWFTLFGIVNPIAAGTQTVSIAYLDNTGFQYATSSINFTIGAASTLNLNTFAIGVIPNSTTLYEVMVLTLPFMFLPSSTKILLEFTNLTTNSTTWLSASEYLYFSRTSPSVLTSTVMSHIRTPAQSFIQLVLYNFTLASSSLSLKVTLSYHTTVFYQQTATTTIASAATAPPNCVASIQFYPQNAAETATYDFMLKQVQLQQGQRLYIGFGLEFVSGLS